MPYETLREANVWLAGAASLWLGYRTVRAWPADWAKPDHVWHYRILLLAQVAAFAVICFGSHWHEENATQAGTPSLLVTILASSMIGFCAHWPRPKPFRRQETQ